MDPGGYTATQETRIEFLGKLDDFLPIWAKNLILTIITLGFYRFWAKTRVRRYLWSKTEVLGQPLEYTGTGMELFIGFLLALVLFVVPLSFISFGAQLMVGREGLFLFFALLLYLYFFIILNFAVYRALRYQLTRTYWRGIRGGMATAGWGYAIKGFLYYISAALTFGLLGPWVAAKLWNARWNDANFGNLQFEADMSPGPLYKRFFIAFVLAIGLGIAFSFWLNARGLISPEAGTIPDPSDVFIMIFAFIGFYVLLGLIFVSFYAVYWRTAIGSTRLGSLEFRFDARTKHWLKFYVIAFLVTFFTFGLGAGWVPYLFWRFMTKHLVVEGQIDPALLEQSQTSMPGQGEGLIDALDMGAV
jgi:uncharacterized membrane protein YjgN (DUF898 family)